MEATYLNDHNILAYILTDNNEFIQGLFNKPITHRTKPKQSTPKIKHLSRRQRRALQGDGLGAERNKFKYTKVRSYSHKIEEIGTIFGGYVSYNQGEEEHVPRQSPYHRKTTDIKNVGGQPLRHFGL